MVFRLRSFGLEFKEENLLDEFCLYPFSLDSFRKLYHKAVSVMQCVIMIGTPGIRGYFRSKHAFRLMSLKAAEIIDSSRDVDAIFQSGVVFSPSLNKPNIPFYLGIIDNTYLMGRRFLPPEIEKFEHNVYHFAKKIFVMSESVRISLMEDYSIPEEKIVVTGVGPNITPDLFALKLDEERYKNKQIVFIGKGFTGKGGWVLLEAFNLVKEAVPDATLVVIGDKIKAGREDVKVTGILDQATVAHELKNASLFVMPSLKEAFGIAFLDAMSFGLPCIGTNVGAIPEIIDDGTTGFIVEPGNSKQLADRMVNVLTDPILASTMGFRGNEKVKEKYSWDNAMKTIYDNVVKK